MKMQNSEFSVLPSAFGGLVMHHIPALAAAAKHCRRSLSRGTFARRSAERLSRESLLFRARLLPAEARTLMTAHLDLGMSMKDLAALQKVPAFQVCRRVARLREALSDPAFLLAARYGSQLPVELRLVAEAHWMEGVP